MEEWVKQDAEASRVSMHLSGCSVSFVIPRACIRLDAHQVAHEFRKGCRGRLALRRCAEIRDPGYGSLRKQRDVRRSSGPRESRQLTINEVAKRGQ